MSERIEYYSSQDGLSNNQVELTRNRIQTLLSNYAFSEADGGVLDEVSSLRDFESFLLTRPYLNNKGKLKNTRSNNEESPDSLQNPYDANYEGYKTAPITGDNSLVSMWADAELVKDKTLSLTIQDVIFDRINVPNMSDGIKLTLIDRVVRAMEKQVAETAVSKSGVFEPDKPKPQAPTAPVSSPIEKPVTSNPRKTTEQLPGEGQDLSPARDGVIEASSTIVESPTNKDDYTEPTDEIITTTEAAPINFASTVDVADKVVEFSSMCPDKNRTVPEDVAGVIKNLRYIFDQAQSEAYALKAYTESLAIRDGTISVPLRNKVFQNRLRFIRPGQRITQSELLRAQIEFEGARDENHKAMRERLAKIGGFTQSQVNSILCNQDLQLVRFISRDQAETMLKYSKKDNSSKLSGTIAKHWANQEKVVNPGKWNRVKGSIKRAAMFSALGVPAGVVGVFASPVAGIGLGIAGFGVAYMSAAKGIRNWRMNKVIETEHVDPESGKNLFSSVLGAQMTKRYVESYSRINKAYEGRNDESFSGPETVADYFTESVERDVKKNRKEMSGAMVSFLGGAAASSSFTILGLSLAGGSVASF